MRDYLVAGFHPSKDTGYTSFTERAPLRSRPVQIKAAEWRGRHSAGQIIPPNPFSPVWAYLNSAGHAACCPALNAPIVPHSHASSRDVLFCFRFTSAGKSMGEQFTLP